MDSPSSDLCFLTDGSKAVVKVVLLDYSFKESSDVFSPQVLSRIVDNDFKDTTTSQRLI